MKKLNVFLLFCLGILIIGSLFKLNEINSLKYKNFKGKTIIVDSTPVYLDKSNVNLGQLKNGNGISLNIFKNDKYSGISNKTIYKKFIPPVKSIAKEKVKIVVKQYNPNILTQSVLVNYYNNEIKRESQKYLYCYYLLDVYNKSYGIFMTNKEASPNKFFVGDINKDSFGNYDIELNENLINCEINKEGKIIPAFDTNKNIKLKFLPTKV